MYSTEKLIKVRENMLEYSFILWHELTAASKRNLTMQFKSPHLLKNDNLPPSKTKKDRRSLEELVRVVFIFTCEGQFQNSSRNIGKGVNFSP